MSTRMGGKVRMRTCKRMGACEWAERAWLRGWMRGALRGALAFQRVERRERGRTAEHTAKRAAVTSELEQHVEADAVEECGAAPQRLGQVRVRVRVS